MAKKKLLKKLDWKHIILFAMNVIMIALLLVIGLVYILPTYRTMVINSVAPAVYRQCQLDTAKAVVNDLNTQGYTQLTIGEQVILLKPAAR